MRRVGKFLKRLLQLILFGVIAFLLYGAWAYRDKQPEIGPGVQFAQLGSANIAYRTDGLEHSDQTPIVMVHHMFYHMGMWDEWADELALTHPVYRFDVAGHGLSSEDSNEDYSLKATMATLDAFLDHHNLDRVVLVGASMGGATSFNYAAAIPDRVEKLVLVNSGGLEGHDDADSAGAPGWIYWILRYLPNWALDDFVDWTAAGNDTGKDFKKQFRENFRAPGTRRGILGRMNDFKSPDTADVLPLVQAPTLIMWGADNPQLPVHQAEDFRALLAQGIAPVTVKIYPGAGHVLAAENIPGALHDLIEFINEPAP